MDFADFLYRIKQELDLKQDKDVADFLNLEIKAFSARKTRNSVPVDKLKAAALANPELKIDVEYILTGKRPNEISVDKSTKVEKELSVEEQELLDIFRQLESSDRHALKRQAQMLLAIAQQEKKEAEVATNQIAA